MPPSDEAFLVAPAAEFAQTIGELAQDAPKREQLSAAALAQARRHYSWERISANLGRILANRYRRLHKRPRISVVVPTYERPELLRQLICRLSAQTFDDFEIIVVDQSASPLEEINTWTSRDLIYVHTDVRGAVSARNTGASIACGEIIAFTDDDCQPPKGWLAAAEARFADVDIAGLEGLIVSDKRDDPNYRPVTNEGFEGIGYMTANLFVRSAVFHAIGGFDICFEDPHFREDTDLGWRALAHGSIPFSREAWLYHPPHKRSVERESLPERSRFFVQDARLLAKHPERYEELFFREAQVAA